MNIHIWPYNWGWAPADSLSEKAEAAQLQSKQYIDEHLEIAQNMANRWFWKNSVIQGTGSGLTNQLQHRHEIPTINTYSA